MKKFLLRLVAFALIVLVGYIVAFASVISLHQRALANCQLGKPGVDSLLVGDSHGMWSIDDASIDGLRNVSLNAEGYKYSYAKLRHVLAATPGLKNLYVSVGYHNLAGYYDEYILGATFGAYIERYLSLLKPKDYEELFEFGPFDFPELTRKAVQRGLAPGLRGECLLYGTFPTEHMTEEFRSASMEKRVLDQFYVDGKVGGVSASNLEYLRKLVELGREHGLRVVVLRPPVHPEYDKRVPAKYRELLAGFVRQHELEHFGFEDLELGDAHFLPDGDHTNYAGAVATTRRFKLYHESH
jgi:hypothetical protein